MYKTLEQQIMELWKSRGIEVEKIEFHAEKGKGIWKITTPIKHLPKVEVVTPEGEKLSEGFVPIKKEDLDEKT